MIIYNNITILMCVIYICRTINECKNFQPRSFSPADPAVPSDEPPLKFRTEARARAGFDAPVSAP